MIFDEMTTMRKLMLLHGVFDSKSIGETATGNPLTFVTDLARPLKSLLIPFSPRQEGTGAPSPENIRSILPWNGLMVFGGGKNLLPNTASSKTANGVTFTVNSDGTISVSGTATGYADLTIGKSEVPNKGKIVLSGLEEAVKIRWSQIRILDANDNVLGDFYGQATTRPYVINMDDYPTAKYVQIGIKREDNNVAVSGTVKPMLEVGETATAYEPYHPITETDIPFASPVYGGTLDVVSGVLTVTHEGLVSTWGQAKVDRKQSGYQQGRMFFTHDVPVSGQSGASATNQKCNIAKYQWDDFNGTPHFYTGTLEGRNCAVILIPEDTPDETEIVVSAKLRTTYEVQLTKAQLTALLGNNTIWSDADGSMTAVYLKKG